ncbi:PilZ domain-containing protein [Geobacter sp. SVR]|uniref:PilZ domain-containing protein n=1 Tax=Geobacter sp. SVR TaxID=2495594 RepID=UPI00143F0386|nr:PilZ domain-containing protein [Geobacter sp. SVR]BCS55640.1 pilus protein PilZ [Geobacter sp. SVR]GCF83644.1 pilus protein PilZ [Geobacter sp. SVR]
MRAKAYHERIISSPADDEASILSIFSDIMTNVPDTDFMFINIYKELPVSNEGRLIDIKHNHVKFKTCQTQLSAINHCAETIIQAPLLNASIIGKLVALDYQHHIVSLRGFSYADVHFDKRNAVRVRLKIPVNVNLNVDGNKISGVIHDISLGGCRVATPLGLPFERARNITLHLKLLHNNQVMQADIPANALRVEGGSPFFCALQFVHTAETEKVLSMFIYQRQLEIIRELKTQK